jgi:hypothetical protein
MDLVAMGPEARDSVLDLEDLCSPCGCNMKNK